MLHESPRRGAEAWPITIAWLVIGFACYAFPWQAFAALPSSQGGEPVLRIQGSNTIGAHLLPELVKGLMVEEGFSEVSSEPGKADNEQRIRGRSANGREAIVELAAHGSSTGFVALKDNSAELAAASRPIKDAEAAGLSASGNLRSAKAEHIIGIDGLAIIVNPANPLTELTSDNLARIYAGEVKTWEELGGRGGEIHLYARDDNSGTFDTFKELVLASHGKALAGTARRFESSDQLSAQVSTDPQGIGFVGLSSIQKAKALAIADGESLAMPPSAALIATEDYPLSRRLFLYMKPEESNRWARALLQFAQGDQGQALVSANGFVGQRVRAVKMEPNAGMPEPYQALARDAQRLSVNFRFREGSATLDNKAQRDLDRLLAYLQQHGKMNKQVVLVGFGDPKQDPARAELLSKLRAMAVRRELAKDGVMFREISGMGAALPVAANSDTDGRVKNRRVEVWVY
ncbi:phosphate ABC transporter substrate-binding/OmpA family protein [Pseudomonas sp. ZM23]|uniref:Phosphate ABC transporter substrate-binding/OmpA family protein n=1 Tax=Pseudomonas triclosanedens TaxID=2961893 RepID=A0ABY7A539_9PSED|nr:phosphate ABC transporter substrate-binding/OmpA family protein [Pseudomonas triclosanedens]MCP8466475.1 phosphate ABC transporter substrate-binding/OmpA family protein [Pseudomonas triclosanedens]MCP8473123.1 phosphate ABC transporter substrate-binding/OmpA family protein [Pseudomonas triclosanedens]MCP8479000.1 phosphate ABC transporter substrate-binding/OmpA family protein [Pseudomonas triclosanedens]WAI52111.1 phosphate ABC transporter substrate-binding/OmpA family protein [Pseudomonas t